MSSPPARALLLRLLAVLLAGVACAGCAASPKAERAAPLQRSPWAASPYDRVRQVNSRLGGVKLDDARWGERDAPFLIGVDYVENIGYEWFGLEGGLAWAYDQAGATLERGDDAGKRVTESVAFFTFSAGVLLAPPPGRVLLRPYVGAGAAFLWTDVDSIVDDALVDQNDYAVGGYAKAGLLFQVTEGTHVGFEVRWLDTGSVSAGPEPLELDGLQFSLILGATFDWFAW